LKEKDPLCDPVLISRFFDGELGAEEYDRVAGHVKDCPACRKRLEELGILSKDMRSFLTGSRPETSPELEQKLLEAIREKEIPWWVKMKEAFFSKRVLFPAGAVASAVLIFFSLFYTPAPSGPSAIVTSLSGSGSSVIIMETPRTRQTILWFDEKG
jgi:anti-sigma factor RsiW